MAVRRGGGLFRIGSHYMSDYPRYGLFQFQPCSFAQFADAERIVRERVNLRGQAVSALARGDYKAHRKALDALHLLDRKWPDE